MQALGCKKGCTSSTASCSFKGYPKVYSTSVPTQRHLLSPLCQLGMESCSEKPLPMSLQKFAKALLGLQRLIPVCGFSPRNCICCGLEHAMLDSPVLVGPVANLMCLHQDVEGPNNMHQTYDGSTGRRAHSVTAGAKVFSLKTSRCPITTSKSPAVLIS